MKTYKVAETYIRIKISATESNKEKLIATLTKEASVYSQELFKGQVKFQIVVEEGSLKGKVTLYGSLLLLIQGISNYGSLRQGLSQLVSDAKQFSEYVIEHTQQDENTYRQNTERTERRLGLPGRLKRTLDRITYLEENIDNLPQREIRRELNELKQDLSNIINSLDNVDQQTILRALPNDLRNSLPEPNDRGMQHLINRYAIKEDEIRLSNEEE